MNLTKSISSGLVNVIINKFDRQENPEIRFLGPPKHERKIPIQKSASASGIIESNRGFKPSDRHDPRKREFLTALSQKIWHVSSVSFPSFFFL